MTVIMVGFLLIGSFALFYFKHNSSIGRLLVYKVCWNMDKTPLLFGVGPGNFSKIYLAEQALFFEEEKGTSLDEFVANNFGLAYNEYLNIIVEHGIFGLIITLLFLWYAFLRLKKSSSLLKNEIGTAFISLAVASCFNFTIYISTIFIQLIILLAFIPPKRKIGFLQIIPNTAIIILTSVLCIMIIRMTLSQLYSSILVEKNEKSSTETVIDYYNSNNKHIQHNSKAMYYYGLYLGKKKLNNEAIEVLELASQLSNRSEINMLLGSLYFKKKEYTRAEKLLLKAHYTTPAILRPRYWLIKIYLITNRKDMAYELAKESIAIGAKVDNKLAQSILTYMNKVVRMLENKHTHSCKDSPNCRHPHHKYHD